MSQKYPKSIFHSLYSTLLLLVSCAVPQAVASQPLRSESGPYELEVLVGGVQARTYMHDGETHILGQAGERYVLRIHNRSGRRIEAVVTVDGLDVIDGKPGDFARKRGYLVPAYGFVDIDGWRLSDREAAAFRFGAIEDSYAARTGRPRNVGVIGVAVFPERRVRVAPRPYSYDEMPVPERRSAPSEDGAGFGSASREAEAAPQPPAAAPMGTSGKSSARAEASSDASADRMASAAPRKRSGLGTEFGEALSSEIREVSFRRADPNTPAYLLGARYNDRAGLLALGIDVDGLNSDLALRQSADPFPVSNRSYARPPMGWQR